MADREDEQAPPERGPAPLESTALLLARVRDGDGTARERLVERFLPLLRRWASGRLPAHARGLADTDDLVQVTLVRALDKVDTFEARREGAFLAYLRQVLLNSLRDEIRRAKRRPNEPMGERDFASEGPSALEQVVGRDTMESYEAALERLTSAQREAVIMRLEFGYGYARIAEAMGRDNPNAARMLVARALVQLAAEMEPHRDA
ncbi:MAG: sigma-70 family RNA polymerase sigma factor [Candidatus Eisenbacteria bacterium]